MTFLIGGQRSRGRGQGYGDDERGGRRGGPGGQGGQPPNTPSNPPSVLPSDIKPPYAPTLADTSILFAGLRDWRNPALSSKFKLSNRKVGRPTLIGGDFTLDPIKPTRSGGVK